ncbi:urocanate hydratase [Strongylocentrotus purpuratus]|uniref:Urocanate hydratase n=1 Tax=Strongylocentrotus purpuratus TaxID=7668 RepID=A0A7M7RC28_STRPU|nr:urocanate hydratase [Strongylocentrotus purpuratus]
MGSLKELCDGLPLDPLPQPRPRDESVAHAPVLNTELNASETRLALQNALRYFPSSLHETLASEFASELRNYGHIYMYRFRPQLEIRAYPIDEYPANSRQAAAIMLMIMNNLDPHVAQFPHELVTYGGNGQVFSNWAQFWLVMYYLAQMSEEQTLVMSSGHPSGLFPSHREAPRVVVANGMMVPNYSTRENYNRLFAMGVTMYGQMTAGSYCYIGPQGIVHGTTLTVLNASRKHIGTSDLRGRVFVTSGLGGMSGAQAKAAVICGCVGVVAEVSKDALMKRYNQGWVMQVVDDVDALIQSIRQARNAQEAVSIGYHGNIVDVWERLAVEYESTGELLADLGSDQTSCHNPFNGGYYPVQLTFDQANDMMVSDPVRFKNLVQESLRRQIAAINKLSEVGLYFFDYGNAFLLESSRAGADVQGGSGGACAGNRFKYPSYVQDIMGDIFSLGFGPFRWVCSSGDSNDLAMTDEIAANVLEDFINAGVPESTEQQYEDNIRWIKEAEKHKMVVGSQARILYSDQRGRIAIALAFNEAVREGKLKGPVIISRDHHDVSGTDSPFRETSNIYDGSAFCADMAIQNVIGDSFRGATWVAIHNGGGVGWGEVINGGFGMVLDGTNEADRRAKKMLGWDVSNGVTRRSWAGNSKAKETICRAMDDDPNLKVTVPHEVQDPGLLDRVLGD